MILHTPRTHLFSGGSIGGKHAKFANQGPLWLNNWVSVFNIGIIHEVKLVHEAQQRDTNGQVVLLLLSTLGRKHILMARSFAEGPNF